MIRVFIGIALFLLPGFYFHYVYLPNIGFSYSLRDGYGFRTPPQRDPANYEPLADASTITRTALVRGIIDCVQRRHRNLPYEISLQFADWLAAKGYDRDPEAAKSRRRKFDHAVLKFTRSASSARIKDIVKASGELRDNRRRYYNCGVRVARAS